MGVKAMASEFPKGFDYEALSKETFKQRLERREQSRHIYNENITEDILNCLKLSPEHRVRMEDVILDAASGYKNFKAKYKKHYASPKQRTALLRKYKEQQEKANAVLKELMTTESNNAAAQGFMYELVYKRSEEDTNEIDKKFIEAAFTGYEGHLHDYEGDLMPVTNLEELRELIDIRNPSQNILSFLECITECSKRELANESEPLTKKDTALSFWLTELEKSWIEFSPIPFTVGHYEEGIGYNSEALHILHMIMKPLDSKLPMESIATAVRKRRVDKRDIARGNF